MTEENENKLIRVATEICEICREAEKEEGEWDDADGMIIATSITFLKALDMEKVIKIDYEKLDELIRSV